MDDAKPDEPQVDLGAVAPEELAKVISAWLAPAPPPESADGLPKE